jgi:pimeloyl-ACP methyl ester carboxylesterase
MHQDPPQEVLDGWTEPAATNPGVRHDVTKVLRGVDKRHTLAAAERLGSFDKPVLIAWAAGDRVFPFADAQKLAAILPNAELRSVQDSYAFIPEDQPEELASLIGEFLGDLEQGDHVDDEQDRERDRPTV